MSTCPVQCFFFLSLSYFFPVFELAISQSTTNHAELSAIKEPNDPEYYFFCPRSYKYANSDRANRTTQAGYWKVTGKDRIVKTKTTKEHIATKKTLVFYEGRVPNGIKTNWIMHEYHPTFSFPNQVPLLHFLSCFVVFSFVSSFQERDLNSRV